MHLERGQRIDLDYTSVIGAIAVGLGVGVAVVAGSLVTHARLRRTTVADPPLDRDPQRA